jgi:hypothetical protein
MRELTDEQQQHLVGVLVWLAPGRFIEHDWGDFFADIVYAYNAARGPLSKDVQDELVDFLYWMAEGDRLHNDGPENPYGQNISFYSLDYGNFKAEECARDMVKYYLADDR